MFLENTWKFFRGVINIKVEGYFIERFINLCMNKEIDIWNIKKINDATLIANIKSLDYNRTLEIAQITRCELIKKSSIGVPIILSRYKKRKAFGIIAFIFIYLIYFYSNRIWEIDIIGDFSIPIDELKNELLTENIHIGMKKKDLNYDTIKNNIYLRRNDIAWMGFDIIGTKATCKFVERKNIEEDLFNNTPCNIVSNKNGIVEKIIVKSGRKNVNIGDMVSSGDILIAGTISNNNETNRKVISEGEIYLKTWYMCKANVPFEKDFVSKTGRKETKYKIEIGKYLIKFLNNDTKFEKYDTISMSNNLRLFNKFELPIKLTSVIYEEIEIDTVNYTKSQAENLARIEATNAINNLITLLNITEYKNNYEVFENESSISIEVTAECIEKVGVKEIIID